MTDDRVSQDTFRANFRVSAKNTSRLNERRCIYGRVVVRERVLESGNAMAFSRCNPAIVALSKLRPFFIRVVEEHAVSIDGLRVAIPSHHISSNRAKASRIVRSRAILSPQIDKVRVQLVA